MNDNSFKKNKFSGFTLIEISFVLLIFGFILAAIIPVYSQYIKNVKITETKQNLDEISKSIADFLTVNGRYPCPAPPSVERGNVNYGRESDECEAVVKTVATGTCDATTNNNTSGICIEDSPRGLAVHNPRVIIGSIPFRQLNIDERNLFDGYGRQFTYAVTENLASKNNYTRNGGGIRIIDMTGVPIIKDNPATVSDDEEASSHFFILSHGENGYGAHMPNGARLSCASASTLEAENCVDTGGNSTFSVSLSSSNLSNDTEYDDLSVAYFSESLPLWEFTGGLGENITVKQPDGNLGAFNPNPYSAGSLTQELDVGGVVRARGDLAASSVCSYGSGTECFEAEKIAGDDPDMECPPGQFLVELSAGVFTCQAQINVTCPLGHFAIGIDSSGNIVCEPESPDDCLAEPVTLCPGDPPVMIPATSHLGITPFVRSASLAGNQRRVRFRCNDGSFSPVAPYRGICRCDPFVEITTAPCDTCQTGTFDLRVERLCPSNTVVSSIINSTCECTASAQAGNCTQPVPYDCPPGFIPDPANPPLNQRIFQCSGTNPLGFGPVTQVPGSGSCICDTMANESRYKACSLQATGFTERAGSLGIPEVRTFNCSLTPPAYDDWVLDSTLTTASNYIDALALHCECDNSTPPLTYTRECSTLFNTATETYSGTVPYRRVWDCSSLPPGYLPEEVDSATPLTSAEVRDTYCTLNAPLECAWKKQDGDSGVGPSLYFAGPREGSLCSCGTTVTSNCHRPNASGTSATNYNNCVCQPR